jgi:purine-binding chemotaxis protein CheW
MPSTADSSPLEILLFEVGGQGYGVPARDVQEVVRAARSVRLPRAPAVIEGVLNLRGQVVPVFDIRQRFGLPAKPLELADQFIVARVAQASCLPGSPEACLTSQRLVALRVDRTINLVQVGRSELEPAAAVVPGAEYVTWMAKLEGGIALIHDLATFLSRAEAADLDAALADAETEGSAP